jgi:hypothetical protein
MSLEVCRSLSCKRTMKTVKVFHDREYKNDDYRGGEYVINAQETQQLLYCLS